MNEMMDLADEIISAHAGGEAATLVHCASAAITLSIASIITGCDTGLISAMPDIGNRPNKIVLARGHNVNYGHPIEQDIRLAGCRSHFIGTDDRSEISEFSEALESEEIAAVLWVESKLTRGNHPAIDEVIAVAHARNIPVIVDAAAQDMRMRELVAKGAELVIFSAQKYLAAPTAGIIVGQKSRVDAVRAQGTGIGRSMKATKEAIIGTIKAIDERRNLDLENWSRIKDREAKAFVETLSDLHGLTARMVEDPCGGDFSRIDVTVNEAETGISAMDIDEQLRNDEPAIYCNPSMAGHSVLNFEILSLSAEERKLVIDRIETILVQARKTRS